MTEREKAVVEAARKYVQAKRTLRNQSELTAGTDPTPPKIEGPPTPLDLLFLAEGTLFEAVDNMDRS